MGGDDDIRPELGASAMNIIFSHRTQGRGGEGVHIREVVGALAGQGHTVELVSPPGVDPLAPDSECEGNRPSILSQLLASLSRSAPQLLFEFMELAYNAFALLRLWPLFRKRTFEVFYERYAFFSIAGVAVAKKFGLTVLLEVNEISGIRRVRAQSMVRLAKRIERAVFTRADEILVVSSYLRDELLRRGIAKEKIHVVPNAIRLKDFDAARAVTGRLPPEIPDLRQKIVLGFVGHFAPWDRLDRLVDEFRKLVQQRQDYHLLLVGYGEIQSDLENRVQENELGEFVTFTGRVPRDRISFVIGSMDIALLPHSNPFGSPLVLFEYMAMARAIVAPVLPPIEDVLSDGEDALLFELDNMDSFRDGIIRLAQDPALRQELGNAARRKVESRFTWDANARRIANLASKHV